FSGLDMMVPGSKYVIGNVVSWAWGADENLWDIPPTQRTIGMLAHSFGHFGLLILAPYDTKNITEQPGADGWQQRELLDGDRSTSAMELLQDYAYDHDTVTVAKLAQPDGSRSEEHTSELQSRFDLVCRLLLEQKKKNS